jgi:hypothetical protein
LKIDVRSWKMIDAETYGMTPRAKMLTCSSAPPEKRLRRLRSEPRGVLPDELLHGLAVGPGDGHEDAHPVDREHAQGEEQPATELRDPGDVGERAGSHSVVPSGSRAPPDLTQAGPRVSRGS